MTDNIIGPGNAFILKACAFFIDCVQAVLLFLAVGVAVNTAVTILAFCFFIIYFTAIDTRILTNPGNLWIATKGGAGEAIPIINILPLWYRTIKKIIDNSNATIGKENDLPKQVVEAEDKPKKANV